MRSVRLDEGPALGANQGIKGNVWQPWRQICTPILVLLLKVAIVICTLMSIMLFVERVYMVIVTFCVNLLRRKRYTDCKLDTVKKQLEATNDHPTVLVQIPMYNEKEVYKFSIRAACRLNWPSDKIVIQVLDDSNDPTIKELVQIECRKWAEEGVNIKCESRPNRNGYKSGALREGLKKAYVDNCDYVAIFDADFQPEADYLWRTIPLFFSNPMLALVQARWKFVNADECIMTRLQELSLDYHFSVEQEVGSSTSSFFGFNGTAGVWRLSALFDAGGWKDRTVAGDMELAIRASLKAWKFVYVGDISVKNELPSTYKAYRSQQHRWACGSANLFRKMFWEIVFYKGISASKKFHLLCTMFFVRKIVAHFVPFFFYCIVLPACVLVPEIHLPFFIAVFIPSTITILNAIWTRRSFHLLIFWILFENVMSLHRTKATIIGLLDTSGANEWVVTEKLGNRQRRVSCRERRRRRQEERVHIMEILVGFYLFYCGLFDFRYGQNHLYLYLFFQAGAFFIMGLGFVGTSALPPI